MIKEKVQKLRSDNPEYRTLLGTVLGEFDRISKSPTDAECIAVIKKMMESNILTGQVDENKVLEQFLPKQLQEEEIYTTFETENFNSIAECMKFFKENYQGLYDGKEVSKLFKEFNNA